MNSKKALRFLLAVAVLFMASANISLLAVNDTAAAETDCPKKVSVVVETVKTAVFLESQFSSQGQAKIVVVKSPVKGLLSEVKVSEGSLVDAGQDLAVLIVGMSEEIKKLAFEAAKAKKILTVRQGWKEKNELAIKSAAKDYQDALELLNQKKAQADRVVKAPVAGIVHLVMAAGSETVADAVLMEISDPRRMQFQISLAASDKGILTIGEKFVGTTEGLSGEVEAEVIAISVTQAVFGVDNFDNKVKEGVTFTFKKQQAQHADAIVLPTAAIQKDSLGDFIYVAEKKKAKKQYITLGKSRAGKTLVLQGLAADALRIVSGLECLVDGKPIRIVNQEELSEEKVEAQAQGYENEKKAAELEAWAKKSKQVEKKAQARKHPMIAGLTFERFTINDKNMRAFYSNWFQHIPGLEVSYQAVDRIDVWAAAKYYSDKRTTLFFEDTVRFTMIPFSLGARFRPAKLGSFEPFVGAGFNVYFYRESIKGITELDPTSGLAFGFHFQGGTYFHFSHSFLRNIFAKHNRFLLGEIFVKYNIVNKTLAEALPEDQGNKINLGGFEMGLGLAVKF